MSSDLGLETEDCVDLFVKFKWQAIWIKEESHFATIKVVIA